jgi:voltage-gated potassium channel
MKQKVFEILDEYEKTSNNWGKIIDLFIISLIILSVIEIILESFEILYVQYASSFYIFELFTVIVFSIEYVLRVWISDLKFPHLSKAKARWKFIVSTTGLIDLIAILPFYLPFVFKFDFRFIRVLRVVRLLRIFKIGRYTKSLRLVGNLIVQKRSELATTIFITFILILISSTIMYNLEHEIQPDKFPNIVSTFWWAVATLTTVGYGDVYPVTGWGQFISGIIAILGIGLVALPTGIISSGFIELLEKKEKDTDVEEKQDEAYKYCPHCGKDLKNH